MNIYKFREYKAALKAVMAEKRQKHPHYTFEKMATASKIQKTYLSRILNGDGNLNEDQLHSACAYLSLNDAETEYLQLLLAHARSHLPQRRKLLKRRIENEQKKDSLIGKHMQSERIETDESQLVRYYSDPSCILTHIFMDLPEYAKAPDKLLDVLKIGSHKLRDTLAYLESIGLIEFKDGVWRQRLKTVSIPSQSPLRLPHRVMMASLMSERIRTLVDEDVTDYAAVFSGSEEAIQEFREQLIAAVKQAQSKVVKSAPNRVYQLNLTLLPWN